MKRTNKLNKTNIIAGHFLTDTTEQLGINTKFLYDRNISVYFIECFSLAKQTNEPGPLGQNKNLKMTISHNILTD